MQENIFILLPMYVPKDNGERRAMIEKPEHERTLWQVETFFDALSYDKDLLRK